MERPRRTSTAMIAILILFVATASASQLASPEESSESNATTMLNSSCPPKDGNADLYGIEILVGVYLQWVASWIANNFSPDNTVEFANTNTFFLAALTIALIYLTHIGTISPAEVFIVLTFCFGLGLTVLSIDGWRTSDRGAFITSKIIRTALLVAIFAYAIWFWAVVARYDSTSCSFFFLFNRVSTASNARFFMVVQASLFTAATSAFALLYTGYWLLAWASVLVVELSEGSTINKSDIWKAIKEFLWDVFILSNMPDERLPDEPNKREEESK
jgi:hypothetical protein